MTTTTYYDLNIVEGSDIVNPLIVDNPNYAKIDETMHNNAVAGVTLATEIANATVHAITRENSDCAVIRFIATSRWKAGDTATVDGVPVTALLPSGETLPDGAYVINANVLCILTGTNLTVYLDSKKVENANDIPYNDTTVGAELTKINSNLNMKYNPDTDMIQIYYNNRWNDWERAYLQGEIIEITLPNMTSNSQNGYVASASTYWNGYEPYKAFSPNGYWCTSQGNNSGWIKLEMPKVYAMTSISYNILGDVIWLKEMQEG